MTVARGAARLDVGDVGVGVRGAGQSGTSRCRYEADLTASSEPDSPDDANSLDEGDVGLEVSEQDPEEKRNDRHVTVEEPNTRERLVHVHIPDLVPYKRTEQQWVTGIKISIETKNGKEGWGGDR